MYLHVIFSFVWTGKSQGLLGQGLAFFVSGEAHLHQRHIVHHRGGNTCVSKPGDIGFWPRRCCRCYVCYVPGKSWTRLSGWIMGHIIYNGTLNHFFFTFKVNDGFRPSGNHWIFRKCGRRKMEKTWEHVFRWIFFQVNLPAKTPYTIFSLWNGEGS